MFDFITHVSLSGVLSTLMMTIFLWFIKYLKIIDVDMVRAIGSFITRSEKTALLPGFIVHLCAGIFFAFCYIFLFEFLPIPEKNNYIMIAIGILLGVVHGVVVSLLLIIMIAENHPIEKYKKAGFGVAAYHFVAHIIYGASLGIFYSLLT